MDLEEIELVVDEREAQLKKVVGMMKMLDDMAISGGKMERINEAPHAVENPRDPLLEELDNLSPLSPLRCIYRVPKRLRRVNEEAYTPQVVSIGPLHHGKEHLKAMEEHKKRYLRVFIRRTGRLAKTPKDVELLVEYGIIENWLGNTKKISTLLDDLGNGVVHSSLYYATLREDLNNYCRTRRHRWMANLRQNYFNTPWSIISVVAAFILLVLTLIQTACSIKSVP